MSNASLGKLAYYLALIGGIILVILGILSFVGMVFPSPMPSLLGGLSGTFGAIVQIILGLIAIYGSKRLPDLMWDIILIIVGLFGGSNWGGILVLLGGIVGLAAKFL
jgi:protein-S-isoprenylcysteine O-methyltransferase Ste14